MKLNIFEQYRIPTYATFVAVALTNAKLASAATTIVSEDFADIPVETELNGQTADIFSSGITTAGGSSTWAADADTTDTGTITSAGSGVSAFLDMGSYINDSKGTASGFFTATATLGVSGGSWVGFGFFGPNTATDAHFANTSSLGSAILLYREDTTVEGFQLGTDNNVDGGTDTYASPQVFTLKLDLTNHNNVDNFGSVTYYANGLSFGSYDYTSNVSFDAFGLTATSDSGIYEANSLTLTQIAVPEPSSTALLGLGGLALILRRRR